MMERRLSAVKISSMPISWYVQRVFVVLYAKKPPLM